MPNRSLNRLRYHPMNRQGGAGVRSKMLMRTRTLAVGLLAVVLPTSYAFARERLARPMMGRVFDLAGRPVGGARPASATPAHLAGSRIMAAGDGALVIDADSGALVKTDRAGKNIGQLAIARDAGLLTLDAAAGVAYVADRRNDRIAVVTIDNMTIASSIKTPAEPYGVALSPDRTRLLVSTIADRTLVAYDVATGTEMWRAPLGSEPRGIAVSPDGTRALVAYLTTGTVDQINLAGARSVEHIAISNAASARRCRRCGNDGDSFARGSFAVTFLGEHQAVVPFQREVPVQGNDGAERTSSYGGGSSGESPLTHQLAFLGFGDGHTDQVTAQIAQHQPRALAWDQAHDALYVAGMGTDSLVQIKNASQASIAAGLSVTLTNSKDRCGPDGLAITAAGNVLVWCSFTRRVEQIELVDTGGGLAEASNLIEGPTLVATAMTAKQHAGLVLFHSAEPQISQNGNLACASCHPDNRADGLSWRIEKKELQTPLLAGRLVGTHPFKWDGTDATLRDSLQSTMQRLGGFGLPEHETDALASYLESLPTVRTPTRDATAVARGKQLFDAEGCRSCHNGPAYTDRERHKFQGTLKKSDTPSLRGISASAPYFHDGSAATLEVLLRDRGAVHGMADTASLTDQQVADLTAFLDTL
jgi:DNA-binding beta-propeller fold protein YncE/mono/diheme cytochrome c family protein